MTLQDFAYLGNDITESQYGSDLERTIVDRDGNTVTTLKAEAYGGGTALLDYAPVLRSLIVDGMGTIASGANLTQWDYNLCVRASINSTQYIFVRAVTRRPSSVTPAEFSKFLTTMPVLRHYKGYPLSISYLIKNNTAGYWGIYVNGAQWETNTGMAALSNVLKCHATSNLTKDSLSGTMTLVNHGSTTDTLQIKEMPVPVHPFYVRWVNNRGGWDYFMFACEHKNTKSLTENLSFEEHASSELASTLYGIRRNYSKRAQETIEVSTGIIDRATYESLAEMPFSPIIQWYDESISRWIEIQVKDAKPEIMASQPTGEMIFEFELPTPQLNK